MALKRIACLRTGNSRHQFPKRWLSLNKVFLFKNMSLAFTKYCCVFTLRFRDHNIKCYSTQCIGKEVYKRWNKSFNPRLVLIDLSGTWPRCNTPLHAAYLYSLGTTCKRMGVPLRSPSKM